MRRTKYSQMGAALKKPGGQLLKEATPETLDLLHMAVGVSGEAGELLDAVKKHAVYGKKIDRENVVEELGGIEFFMEGLRQNLNITRAKTLRYNARQLAKRYPGDRYSNDDAIARKDKQ